MFGLTDSPAHYGNLRSIANFGWREEQGFRRRGFSVHTHKYVGYQLCAKMIALMPGERTKNSKGYQNSLGDNRGQAIDHEPN
jgi:hypothetical protein